MYKKLFIFLLLSNLYCNAQELILTPHPSENGTRFNFSQEKVSDPFLKKIKIDHISVVGSFNNWNKNQFFMVFDSVKNLWWVDVKLPVGNEYHYKFIINDSLWITDPFAPNVTEDEWRNGIVIPIEFNAPYVMEVNPPNGKRITKLIPFMCKLVSPFGKIDPNSIECYLDKNKIKHSFNKNSQMLKIKLPKDLEEGEHKILIKFSDENGFRNNGFVTKFFLDRYKAKIRTPPFYDRAIIYEIFIRKFADSDNDGIGDFNGLTSKLDYLKELGIDAIWQMPYDESSKDHGYNVVDYFYVEKDYGTFDEYLTFLKAAKERNIRVIKDIVINHCDTTFEYFRDARNNPSSKYSTWFQFIDSSNSDWKHFGIEKDMPKFNFENEEVQNYFINYIKFWMDPNRDGNFEDGIDGIRCDAAKEIPHQFWNRLRKELKRLNKDFLILGEVWDGTNYLISFFEDEFDMLFDYPFYYALQEFFNSSKTKAIKELLNTQNRVYPKNFQMLRFLSNHDNHRALSLFNGDTLKYFQAITLLFTLPQTPMIYYGDEIGLVGKTPPENVRQFMDWSKIKNNLIFNLYKNLIEIRKKYSALSERDDSFKKSLRFLESSDEGILIFERYTRNERILIILNNSNDTIENFRIELQKARKICGEMIFDLNSFLNGKNLEKNLKVSLNSIKLIPRDIKIIKMAK